VGQGSSDGYYEEVREGQIIPAGSQAQPGSSWVLGRGYADFLENPFHALRRVGTEVDPIGGC
jgi:hypothetical protein